MKSLFGFMIGLKRMKNIQDTLYVLVMFVYCCKIDLNFTHFMRLFYQIPPAPPRPDFDASREKLQKLGEGEGTITKEEYIKMKQELEA